MSEQSVWNRVGGWIKTVGRKKDLDDLGPTGADGLLARDASSATDDATRPPAPLRPISRRQRQEEALIKLQEGYERVAGLIDSIHNHLDAQAGRTAQLADAIQRLAGSLSDLPDTSRRQAETLSSIAGELQKSNTQFRDWSEILATLPRSADAQAEALNRIDQQLAAANQTDERIVDSFTSLQQAVSALGASANSQVETLVSLKEAAQQREDHLAEQMQDQSKRFTMLFVVTLVLAVAAIVAIVLERVL